MEKWNLYTKDGKLTDKVLIRGESIPEGFYFMACEVMVRHIDGSYLCMKRSKQKKNFGGYLEATAGGAVVLGEDKYQCVKRELLEETGLYCEKFNEIGSFINEENHSIFYSFVCTVDCDKDSVKLQVGETEGYVWMSEEEFIQFVNSGEMIPPQYERHVEYFKELRYICD